MNYISTRGLSRKNYKSFSEVTMEGLAADGGLYVPENIPKFSKVELDQISGFSYVELCVKVISKFTDEYFTENDIKDIAIDSYKNFNSSDIAPLIEVEKNKYILELFHGPTLAFKDFALQLLSRVFNLILERNNKIITIIGATSGDTGSAAIEAFKNNTKTNIFILHPKGKVSDFQRKQMTTVNAENVYNIAIEGSFDDCQALVKNLFMDNGFKNKFNLASINSINWCRVLAQVIYYFYSTFKIKNNNNLVNFSVPTGNFGDAYAGYIAKKMGLPINKIIIATNSNDILARFFTCGEYKVSKVVSTLSPSMDIQVASNFERLLFESLSNNTDLVKKYMNDLNKKGFFKLSNDLLKKLNNTFIGISISDASTIKCMNYFYKKFGITVDPHTAVGLQASYINRSLDDPIITLATAHADKFSQAVEKAIGKKINTLSNYNDLFERKEKFKELNNNLDILKTYISKNLQYQFV
tara:strand:+ start:1828 stop:3234 length:1407 start_codon:yes stop_codon:yes gene_type:complete